MSQNGQGKIIQNLLECSTRNSLISIATKGNGDGLNLGAGVHFSLIKLE
jgi:hypothetical protein